MHPAVSRRSQPQPQGYRPAPSRNPFTTSTPPRSPYDQSGGAPHPSQISLVRTASDHGSIANHPSLTEKFVLPLDPTIFNVPESDDKLHNPDPVRDRKNDRGGTIFSARGMMNLGCIFILAAGIVVLFAGYPMITYFTSHKLTLLGGFNVAANDTGQMPDIPGNWGMIDRDTPMEVRTKVDYVTGKTWELVFSDEFNVEGRTFYPGDDPYWEAADLHYWSTGNMEWYDPAMITTRNGSLEITVTDTPSHGLDYTGGMMTTWNKFCFTGGLVETSVMLPGSPNVKGLWPAVWSLGNLGRAGYGATLDGMWPYTYDACDVGTVSNQTMNDLPVEATEGNDPEQDGALSFLPGQRLSRCTCPGESHPGPMHENGDFVGRSAPEIDVLEAQIDGPLGPLTGAVSQSSQWAPFNYQYKYNTTGHVFIPDPDVTALNEYRGSVYQQATSGVSATNQEAYETTGFQYSVYGFQYKPGFGDAYLAWISDNKLAWRLDVAGMGADNAVEISARGVPEEPMYLIMNLGLSQEFGIFDASLLTFPATMRVDWIRVYQDPANTNYGCDPPNFPTKAYIEAYPEAYTNPNLTTWVDDYKQPWPKNRWLGEC